MVLRQLKIKRSNQGRVCRVVMPGGCLSAGAAQELSDVAQLLLEDRQIRMILLEAEGEHFCSGAGDDLDPIAISPDPASAWASLRVPVVVVIRGECRSVGLEIVLAGDIRVVHRDATFSFPDVRQGVLPCWGGTQRLSRAIRPSEATAMLLLGSELSAERALVLGLVHRCCNEVSSEVDLIIEQLLAVGPLATEMAKEAVHRGSELALRDGLRLEGDLNHQLAATDDRKEGLAAFFDKRPPDFSGR